VTERGERFINANKVLLDQVVAVLNLAKDLSTPMQMTNAMKMANDMARDVQGLLNRNELTAGAVAQVIVARTGQNPSLQAPQGAPLLRRHARHAALRLPARGDFSVPTQKQGRQKPPAPAPRYTARGRCLAGSKNCETRTKVAEP